MVPGGPWPSLVEVRRDEHGNRRMWASQRDAYIERLRQWRRVVRRMAGESVSRVREKMPLRLVALTLLTLALSVFYVHWRMPPKPDPSYLEARGIVQQYELGKTYDALNYHHTTYVRALELLSQVDPHSISAYDARRFNSQLINSIARFDVRRAEERAAADAARAAAKERDDSLESAQRRTSGVDKAAVFAHECEEELEQYEARMDVLEGLRE